MALPVIEHCSTFSQYHESYIHNHSIQFNHNSLAPNINSQNSHMNSMNDNESVFQLFFDLSICYIYGTDILYILGESYN